MATLLTPKFIDNLTAPLKGRKDYWDSNVEGFGVRITDKGAKSYSFLTRLNGKPVRYTIGPTGKWTLAAARDKAREYQTQIIAKIDPREVEKKEARAKVAANDLRFEKLLERYIATKVKQTVRGPEITAMLRREFGKPWDGWNIDTIKTKDIADLILAKIEGGHPSAARAMLANISPFFKWAVSSGATENVPCYAISAASLLGERVARSRVLTDAELTKTWNAALELGYPAGPVYLLLILTGLRLNAVVGAKRSEIDRRAKVWTIPAERMKGRKQKRKPFAVPLTDMMIAVFDSLPRFNEGECLFSKDNGVTSIIWSPAFNDAMKMASRFYDWRNHDLRRTMRTRLVKKPIGMDFMMAEIMIAHSKGKIGETYDLHDYLDEKRIGFAAWSAEVARITGGLPKRLRLVA